MIKGKKEPRKTRSPTLKNYSVDWVAPVSKSQTPIGLFTQCNGTQTPTLRDLRERLRRTNR